MIARYWILVTFLDKEDEDDMLSHPGLSGILGFRPYSLIGRRSVGGLPIRACLAEEPKTRETSDFWPNFFSQPWTWTWWPLTWCPLKLFAPTLTNISKRSCDDNSSRGRQQDWYILTRILLCQNCSDSSLLSRCWQARRFHPPTPWLLFSLHSWTLSLVDLECRLWDSTISARGAFFAWRAPIVSWPRIMCSQAPMLKFLEPSREVPYNRVFEGKKIVRDFP